MPNIKIAVAGKIATNTTPGVVIVCGNSDYTVTFDLDAEWGAAPNRTARFAYYKNGLRLFKDVPFTGDTVAVPKLSNIEYVMVGVYAGDLHTTTPAQVLCDLSILCGDALEDVTPENRAALQAQIGDLSQLQTTAKGNLVAAINEAAKTGGTGSGSGENANGGMSATASALLISILRNAMYTADQSANITALEAALASGGGGGTDVPDTPVEPGVTYYTIVNVLTNVTNSNSTAKAAEGESYTATLTPADGFNMSTVTVTMGGVNVTADVYAGGTITIENVTGNVIITASAVEDSATAPAFQLASPLVLGDTTDPRINDTANCRIATGETVNDDEDWTLCIDFTSVAGVASSSSKVRIYANDNNQVAASWSAPNWNLTVHGHGALVNDYAKVDGNNVMAGKNMVVVATWNSATKTYQTYGAVEYTKTFESITTASDGQLYVGNIEALGTFNRFALYKRVLSADEITAWIG